MCATTYSNCCVNTATSGEKFDVIVMDPPKFVENKSQLMGACRGYKDINMLAIQLLNPGGVLLTFSCSGLMTTDLFQKSSPMPQ